MQESDDVEQYENGELGLAEVIDQLRQDLKIAYADAKGEEIRFVLEKTEVELQICTSRKSATKGGVAVWVVNASKAGERSNTVTHTIRLSLTPQLQNEGALRLHGNVDRGAGH